MLDLLQPCISLPLRSPRVMRNNVLQLAQHLVLLHLGMSGAGYDSPSDAPILQPTMMVSSGWVTMTGSWHSL